MSQRIDNPWDALDAGWYYLGREVAGGFDIATLLPTTPGETRGRRPAGRAAPLAAAFTSESTAAEFVAVAPRGIDLLSVAADDLRAKEEWLRALLERGTTTLVFDPPADTLHEAFESATSISVHTALGYILSHRHETACF